MLFAGCGQTNASGDTGVEGTEITEDVAQEEIPSGNVSLRVWGDGEDAELLAQMVESFQAEYAGQATFDITIEAQTESECKNVILGDIENAADVFFDRFDMFAIGFDQGCRRRSARESLYAYRARAGEKVEKPLISEIKANHVEKRLAHTVLSRSNRVRFRHFDCSAAMFSAGYAHNHISETSTGEPGGISISISARS